MESSSSSSFSSSSSSSSASLDSSVNTPPKKSFAQLSLDEQKKIINKYQTVSTTDNVYMQASVFAQDDDYPLAQALMASTLQAKSLTLSDKNAANETKALATAWACRSLNHPHTVYEVLGEDNRVKLFNSVFSLRDSNDQFFYLLIIYRNTYLSPHEAPDYGYFAHEQKLINDQMNQKAKTGTPSLIAFIKELADNNDVPKFTIKMNALLLSVNLENKLALGAHIKSGIYAESSARENAVKATRPFTLFPPGLVGFMMEYDNPYLMIINYFNSIATSAPTASSSSLSISSKR